MNNRRVSAIDVPFLVTVLFGVMAWSTVHFIDRNTSSPLVEYKKVLKCPKSGGQCNYRVRLKNLSFDSRFDELKFVFLVRDEEQVFFDYSLSSNEPAWEGPAPTAGEPPNSVTFVVPQLHPGQTVWLGSGYSVGANPYFALESASSAIRLRERGLLTLLVRAEGNLLIFALAVSLVLASIWFLRDEKATER